MGRYTRLGEEGRKVRTSSHLPAHLPAPPPPVSPSGELSRAGRYPSQAHRRAGPPPPAAVDGAEPPSPCAPRASYSESEVKDYLWQMLSAAQYLHAQSILHLDLRSENMIVTEYNLLKVVDLGNAQSLAQERVLPSERFKDYVETMGALGADANLTWGEGWAKRKPPPPPGLPPSPLCYAHAASHLCAHLCPPQLPSSWKARVPSHRPTSGP